MGIKESATTRLVHSNHNVVLCWSLFYIPVICLKIVDLVSSNSAWYRAVTDVSEPGQLLCGESVFVRCRTWDISPSESIAFAARNRANN